MPVARVQIPYGVPEATYANPWQQEQPRVPFPRDISRLQPILNLIKQMLADQGFMQAVESFAFVTSLAGVVSVPQNAAKLRLNNWLWFAGAAMRSCFVVCHHTRGRRSRLRAESDGRSGRVRSTSGVLNYRVPMWAHYRA